jgi:hypothetical protein
MRFTVTSGVGVTEVVERYASARAALELWRCSGVSEMTFASLMRTAGVEPRRNWVTV